MYPGDGPGEPYNPIIAERLRQYITGTGNPLEGMERRKQVYQLLNSAGLHNRSVFSSGDFSDINPNLLFQLSQHPEFADKITSAYKSSGDSAVADTVREMILGGRQGGNLPNYFK